MTCGILYIKATVVVSVCYRLFVLHNLVTVSMAKPVIKERK